MRSLFFISLLLVFLQILPASGQDSPALTGTQIVENSIRFHDPEQQWETFADSLLFIEPRVEIPERKSFVYLDNAQQAFSMTRPVDSRLITHVFSAGKCSFFIDGQPADLTDSTLVQTFRLTCAAAERYRNFYHFMYGLPMSLEAFVENILPEAEATTFDGRPALRINVILKKPVFTSEWHLFFDPENFQLLGCETVRDEEGERLLFRELVKLKKIRFTRVHTWYDKVSDEYLGTDLLFPW